MLHFGDHTTIASPQFGDPLKVIILQLAHFGLLCQESFQALLLLFIQLQFLELLLEVYQVCPGEGKRSRRNSQETARTAPEKEEWLFFFLGKWRERTENHCLTSTQSLI